MIKLFPVLETENLRPEECHCGCGTGTSTVYKRGFRDGIEVGFSAPIPEL